MGATVRRGEVCCGGLHRAVPRLLLQLVVVVVVVVLNCCCGPALASQVQGKPRIYSLRVYSDIKFHFATTLVTSRVLNPGPTAREAVFEVTLPNQAFISNFTLEIGGKVYPGQVKEKEEAQKQYDKAKKRGQSAGQVKQKPRETNQFKVEINVASEEKVTFNLTYQEVLERRLGVYEHVIYINPGQAVEDLSIEVAIEENREITYLHVPPLRNDLTTVDLSATHSSAVVSRPDINRAVIRYDPSPQEQVGASTSGLSGLFTVRYDVDRTLSGGDLLVVNGYFVHFFSPEVAEPVPKNVLFILDTSTSMQGEKIQQLKDAMRSVLSDMTEGDRFGIMEFNSRSSFWKGNLVPVTAKNIKKAFEYVNRRRPTGSTNMNQALTEGLRFLNGQAGSAGSNMVIFLTDGVPTTGETNRDRILRNTINSNSQEMPIYGLSFGANADWALVKKLAVQNNGLARRIYEDSDSALQIQGFYKEVSTLLLTQVQAKYLDDSVDPASLTRSSFKNFFNGSEIIIAGKLLDTTAQSLTVNMEAVGVEGGLTLTSSANALDLSTLTSSGLMDLDDLAEITQKMWAYLTLKQILKQQVGEEDLQKKAELKQKAVDLSLKYGFVTPVTSMVVTKPEEDGVGDLEEDDSELQDDSDVSARGSRRRTSYRRRGGGGGGGGGGGSRGGGGGDPHFMMELSTLPYPLCFDVDGHTGEAFQVLRDPQIGLAVNVELGEGHRPRDHPFKHGSIYRVYIFKVAIILNDIIGEITREGIRIDGNEFYWNISRSVRLPGVWVVMTDTGVLRFVLDSGLEVDVKKKVHPSDNLLGVDFLDVEVENEQLLSKSADGLLGRFVHMKITMTKLVKKGGRLVAHLRNRSGKYLRHGSAFLKERKDPFFNRTTPCLILRARGTRLLDYPTKAYKVRNLFHV
ncbi:inter-alpha-trypsin inhibitor heavy chain H3-like [Babylonia areolata]|uniref:inter-alpha-trypsin inhibitor heavy chain H3-like n=1 Tax=Babylonia areolata TaxID=304850 RepID=UPI003FD2AE6A